MPESEHVVPVPVNAIGDPHAGLTRDKLPPRPRAVFDAQLAAWEAACEFARVAARVATFGGVVPSMVRERWETARDMWEWHRWQRAANDAREREAGRGV